MGSVDHRLFYRPMGCRAGRNRKFPDKMDERRRARPAPGFLRRRLLQRAASGPAIAGGPASNEMTSWNGELPTIFQKARRVGTRLSPSDPKPRPLQRINKGDEHELWRTALAEPEEQISSRIADHIRAGRISRYIVPSSPRSCSARLLQLPGRISRPDQGNAAS